MENRPFGSEEQDDSTPEASTKKKRGGSKLSRYLSGLRRKENEDSKEVGANAEKPKRLRNIFSRLFPSIVENPNLDQDKDQDQQHQFNPENWFSWMQSESKDPAPEISINHPETVEMAAGQKDQQDTEAVSAVEGAQNMPQERQSESLPPAPETPPPIEWLMAPEKEQPQPNSVGTELPPTPEQELYSREKSGTKEAMIKVDTGTSEKSEKEVVVERGPGMVLPVALVGLEHLGRKKADKKLEKRVKEEIASTNAEVKRGAALQQELESLARQNSEQLEALKRAREGRPVESVPTAQKTAEIAPARPPERATTTIEQPKHNIEQPKPASDTKEQSPLVAESRVATEEAPPQKILEQVVDAAEHDIPVERVFERSHEVKDDKSVPITAASVGAVVGAHAAAKQYQALQQSKHTASAQNGTTPFVNDPVAAAAYKQAIKMGFWTAVMIIILGSIAYLMVK